MKTVGSVLAEVGLLRVCRDVNFPDSYLEQEIDYNRLIELEKFIKKNRQHEKYLWRCWEAINIQLFINSSRSL